MKPFEEVWNMVVVFYKGSANLDRPYFWVRFFGFLSMFFILVGISTKDWLPAYVATGVTLIALLRFEWLSGRFHKWHLDNIKRKAKKQLGDDYTNVPLEERVPVGYEKRGITSGCGSNYPYTDPVNKKQILHG